MRIKNYIIIVVVLLFNLLIVNQVFAEDVSVDDSVYKTLKSSSIIPVEGISFDTNKLTLFKDNLSVYLPKLNILPSNATNQNYILTSSNNNVLTVKENGLIVPISIGESTVVAKTYDGKYGDYCNIIILDNPPTKFIELPLKTCPKNKVWTIKFNKGIIDNINELDKKIYVTDEDGNYVKTRLNNNYGIIIHPLNDYEPDKKYYIYILKGIKGENNAISKYNNRMTFTTEY